MKPTQEQVIALAREAGLLPSDAFIWSPEQAEKLERFAALVVAAEREACAKLCEAEEQRILSKQSGRDFDQVDANLRMIACILPDIADAIRARGEQ